MCGSLLFSLPRTFPAANFSSVTNVSGAPVENPTTIQVSWSVPDSSCFQFDRFQAKCTPKEGGEIGTDSVSNPEGGGVMAVDVGGLKGDTVYLCDVTSTLSDLVTETVFDHMTVSEVAMTFTLPEGMCAHTRTHIHTHTHCAAVSTSM